MHYTTKTTTITIRSIATFKLVAMSLTPDKVEVYKVEADGMESWCGYVEEIPHWQGGRTLAKAAAELLASGSWRHPGHPSLQTTLPGWKAVPTMHGPAVAILEAA